MFIGTHAVLSSNLDQRTLQRQQGQYVISIELGRDYRIKRSSPFIPDNDANRDKLGTPSHNAQVGFILNIYDLS